MTAGSPWAWLLSAGMAMQLVSFWQRRSLGVTGNLVLLVISVAAWNGRATLKNQMPLDKYQMAEHFQTGVNPTKARVGYMLLPSSAKDFVSDGVVLRTPGFSIGPLDTFALWSGGNVDPLVHRVLSLLKEIKRELRDQAHRSARSRTEVSARLSRCRKHVSHSSPYSARSKQRA